MALEIDQQGMIYCAISHEKHSVTLYKMNPSTLQIIWERRFGEYSHWGFNFHFKSCLNQE